MNGSNVFGLHSVFYFYGIEHLALNLSQYIREGMQNDELVYLYMLPELYEQFTAFLNTPIHESIRVCSNSEFILSYSEGGQTALRERIMQITGDAVSLGYSGVRMISQASRAIRETSCKEFLAWDQGLGAALENTRFSVLCIYDVSDLIQGENFIAREVFGQSLEDHSHILYQLHLQHLHSLRL